MQYYKTIGVAQNLGDMIKDDRVKGFRLSDEYEGKKYKAYAIDRFGSDVTLPHTGIQIFAKGGVVDIGMFVLEASDIRREHLVYHPELVKPGNMYFLFESRDFFCYRPMKIKKLQ